MNQRKTSWLITPGLSDGKNAWHVRQAIRDTQTGSERSHDWGFYSSLKRAKAVVAHLRRKPIELK